LYKKHTNKYDKSESFIVKNEAFDNTSSSKIEIKSRNARTYFALVLILFIFYIIYYYKFQITNYIEEVNSLKLLLFSIIAFLILIVFTVFIIIQLIKKKGLVINEVGILDKSNVFNFGVILWEDIKEIKTTKDLIDEIILIYIDDTTKYLGNINNRLSLKVLQKNQEIYGTCFIICISV